MLASQRIRHLAERLVGQETSPKEAPSETVSSFHVCERLRQPLSSLTGKAGFQALLSRALTLTKPEFPQLELAKVNADGHLEGMAEIRMSLSTQEAAQMETALVAHIVELLCTFLGEILTIRLLQDVWPDASFNESNSRKEITA